MNPKERPKNCPRPECGLYLTNPSYCKMICLNPHKHKGNTYFCPIHGKIQLTQIRWLHDEPVCPKKTHRRYSKPCEKPLMLRQQKATTYSNSHREHYLRRKARSTSAGSI